MISFTFLATVSLRCLASFALLTNKYTPTLMMPQAIKCFACNCTIWCTTWFSKY